jgi:hypothetical protein
MTADKRRASQLELTMFTETCHAKSSKEEDGIEPRDKAIVLRLPPYLDDSREARLTQMDSILNDLRVEIQRMPVPSRYITRLILDAFLEIRDALGQEDR